MQRIFLAAFLTLFGLALMPALSMAATYDPPLEGEMAKLKVFSDPKDMPNIVFTTPDGKNQYLHDLKGRIVLINMWATWCPPCVKELPSLNALQHSMDPNYLTVLAVSVDAGSDIATPKFLEENKLDKLVPYIDKNEALMQLEHLRGAQGIPITLIVDPQSRLLAFYQGDADWNGPDARATLDYYMKNVRFVPFNFGTF